MNEAKLTTLEQIKAFLKGTEARYKHTEIAVKLLRGEIGRALKAGEEVPGVARLEETTRLEIQ